MIAFVKQSKWLRKTWYLKKFKCINPQNKMLIDNKVKCIWNKNNNKINESIVKFLQEA